MGDLQFWWHMKTRVEVDEMGRHIIVLPEEIIEEWQLEDGDTCTYTLDEITGSVVLHF